MTRLDFIKMCHSDQAARSLLKEVLGNSIKEHGHTDVEGIILTTELELEALIRLVQGNGNLGFDMLEIYQ